MSFFQSLLTRNNLSTHDGRPLWGYFLTDQDFEDLQKELSNARPYTLDARDASLYYAEWWKRNYNGGIPNKERIFNSLEGNIKHNFSINDFYRIAKKGGQILGFKWIVKQNTLRFKTLLLQGGLPLTHIAANQGKYLNFLLSVLEEQPESIEDFIFQPHIINYLPKSSQNDIVYENCFEIVRSILNEENIYDKLLNSNSSLKIISGQLKIRANKLERKVRLAKPKNYWLLQKNDDEVSIRLTLGLASNYTNESLKNILGFDIKESEYQFYLNDQLICKFSKLISGNYKTDWYKQQNHQWDGDDNLPNAYIITNEKKIEVKDFIQTMPSLYEPTLWSKFSENEWRLIKGSGSVDKSAALLMPLPWYSQCETQKIRLIDEGMHWLEFEGEMQIKCDDEKRKYYSDVESFDWTIESENPSWIVRSNMPVIRRNLSIHLFDTRNNKIPNNKYQIWIRPHTAGAIWQKIAEINNFPLGCIDVKIEKEGLIAYDLVYSIGNLSIDTMGAAIHKATVEVKRLSTLDLRFAESPVLEISKNANQFLLNVKADQFKIPTIIKGSLGLGTQRKLFFQMTTPFQGMALVDKEGNIINENENISFKSLYGLRVLSTPGKETVLRFKNKVNSEVKISKVINEAFQPLTAYIDEIERLYYLSDAMDYRNKVCLELREGQEQKSYEISGFSHTLDVEQAEESILSLYNSEDTLDLFAVPVSGSDIDVTPIPLLRESEHYKIPFHESTNQWIIISQKKSGNQLMPRFVNTNPNYIGLEKNERIQSYAEQFLEDSFENGIWIQLLSLFNICSKNGYDIPFSTFDQFRALSLDSKIAAKAFLFLSVNQVDREIFLQKDIPEMEKDLGICFHWIKREDWRSALNEICDFFKIEAQNMYDVFGLISEYMQENGLGEVFSLMMGNKVETKRISHMEINTLRFHLGERVLKELPGNSPRIQGDYGIPINQHKQVKLLIKAPIAVAESIKNVPTDYPIWGQDEIVNTIRRNIQYSEYLSPEFYKNAILNILNSN
jgi:hypothetical protein